MTAAIDRLFKLMCEEGASDLHLCVGMPPLIRKDGSIQILDLAAPPARFDDDDLVDRADHAGEEQKRSSRAGTTPTSPTRSRGWLDFARTSSWTGRVRARSSV